MKKALFILGVAILTLGSFSNSHKDVGNGMCMAYFPLEKGAELTYENYNAKDKLLSTDYMKVEDVIDTDTRMTIVVHTSNKDKKGEDVYESDFEFYCENGVFTIPMESKMDPEIMKNYEDIEMGVDQSGFVLPSNMEIGQTLPDAQMTLELSANGTKVTTIVMDITERKVEAIETITTPAGTFEAYKYSQLSSTKVMFLTSTYKTVDWVVENVGSVRSENYNESGKLVSYRVLTDINR